MIARNEQKRGQKKRESVHRRGALPGSPRPPQRTRSARSFISTCCCASRTEEKQCAVLCVNLCSTCTQEEDPTRAARERGPMAAERDRRSRLPAVGPRGHVRGTEPSREGGWHKLPSVLRPLRRWLRGALKLATCAVRADAGDDKKEARASPWLGWTVQPSLTT